MITESTYKINIATILKQLSKVFAEFLMKQTQ